MNKYTKRLIQEWEQHGKIIIGCDYDDTISPWKFKSPEDLVDLDKTIQLLRIAHETGAYIVIFSACDVDRYPEIQAYCESIKLPIDAINRNPFELPYGNNGKIYANIYLDDRAGLTESLKMLEECVYIQRSSLQQKKPTIDVA